MIKLGDRVKDRISGIKGIVIGITDWLYGCRRITIQPEENKDGKPAESFCIDEPQAAIVKESAIIGREEPTHGPRMDARRRRDPVR